MPFGGWSSCRRGGRGAIHQLGRRSLPECAVRPNVVVVSTPSLHLRPGVVKRQEPMRVQALCPELAVERFNERVVRRFARPGEVEHNALLVGPHVQITRDELAALVDTDRLRIANLPADTLQRLDHVRTAVVEPSLDARRIARKNVNNRQNPQLPARRKRTPLSTLSAYPEI